MRNYCRGSLGKIFFKSRRMPYMETLCGFGMCLCDWNMIPALNQLPCLLFLFVFFLLPFLVLTLWSVPSHRTVQTDKGRNCLLALSTGCSAIRMATIIIICKLSWSPKASGTTVKVMSDLKKKKSSRFSNKFFHCQGLLPNARSSLLMNEHKYKLNNFLEFCVKNSKTSLWMLTS